MSPSKNFPRVRGIPSLFRSLGIAAFLVGLLVSYVDFQKMADRRMVLNARVAQGRTIDDFVRAGTMPAGDEVALRARVVPGARFLVSYRSGLARKSAQVVPLWSADEASEPAVLGFAHADADAPPLVIDGGDTGLVEVLGLAVAPGSLAPRVRDTLRAAGIPVAQDLFAVMPHVHGREAALTAPVRSPWRGVMFWLSAVLLVGGHILNVETYRIRAERRRIALARASEGRAARQSVATDRFTPLAEFPETPAEARGEAALGGGWISRARQFISGAA